MSAAPCLAAQLDRVVADNDRLDKEVRDLRARFAALARENAGNVMECVQRAREIGRLRGAIVAHVIKVGCCDESQDGGLCDDEHCTFCKLVQISEEKP